MDLNAEIDAALEALSDCSQDESDHYSSGDDNEQLQDTIKTDDVDWMKLFLERTNEQSRKIEDGLCDAEVILEEVNKTMNECHSARLAILDADPELKEKQESNWQMTKVDTCNAPEDLVSEHTIKVIEQESLPHSEFNVDDTAQFDAHKEETDRRILSFEMSFNEEVNHRIDDIEAKRMATEQHLQDMEKAERQILVELNRQKAFYEEERNNAAACKIQSYYRRYIIRKEYGEIIDKRLKDMKEERTLARIQAIEEKRRKHKANEELRKNSKIPDENQQEVSGLTNDPTKHNLHDYGVITKEAVKSNVNHKTENEGNGTDTATKDADIDQPSYTFLTDDCHPEKSANSLQKTVDNTKNILSVLCNSAENKREAANYLPVLNHNFSATTSMRTKLVGNVSDFQNSDDAVIQQIDISNQKFPTNISITDAMSSSTNSVSSNKSVTKSSKQPNGSQSTEKHGISPDSEPTEIKNDLTPNRFKATKRDLAALEKSVSLVPVLPKASDYATHEVKDKCKDKTTLQGGLNEDIALLEASVCLSFEGTNEKSNSEQKLFKFDNNSLKSFGNPDSCVVVSSSTSEDFSARSSTSTSFCSISPDTPCDETESLENGLLNDGVQRNYLLNSNEKHSKNKFPSSDEIQQSDSCVTVGKSLMEISTEHAKEKSSNLSLSIDDSTVLSKDLAHNANEHIDSQLSSPHSIHVQSNTPDEIEVRESHDIKTANSVDIMLEPVDQRKSLSLTTSDKFNGKTFETNSTSDATNDKKSLVKLSPPKQHAKHRAEELLVKPSMSEPLIKPVLEDSPITRVSCEPLTHNVQKESLLTLKQAKAPLQPLALCTTLISQEFDTNQMPEKSFAENDLALEDTLGGCAPETSPMKPLLEKVEAPVNSLAASVEASVSKTENTTLLCQSPVEAEDDTHEGPNSLKSKPENASINSPFDANFSLTKAWANWKNHCMKWSITKSERSPKPRLRRIIRKSSAAKKLPPLTDEEIINGKWPHYKELPEERTIESLSRIFIHEEENRARNLMRVFRCVNLTHLTLIKCGLVSLEGLQACPSLRHINASYNDISFISCDEMKRLESLVAISNRLTSIHGLTRCNALLLLDMSHNNITHISGLDETPNLLHLRLSHNQLLNILGLKNIHTLLSLDISFNNISTLQGIEHCGLLRYLNASDNYFNEIPVKELTNLVLLLQLDLSGNSLSQIHFKSENVIFLPSLRHLFLQRNKISLEEMDCLSLSSIAPQLQELNVSKNLISDVNALIREVKDLQYFTQLVLSENLISKEQEMEAFEATKDLNYELTFSDEAIMPTTTSQSIKYCFLLPSEILSNLSVHQPKNNYFMTISEQASEYGALMSSELTEVKAMRGWKTNKNRKDDLNDSAVLLLPPDALSCHCDYLKKHFEMAIRHRHAHEDKPLLLSPATNLKQQKEDTDATSSSAMLSYSRVNDLDNTKAIFSSTHEEREGHKHLQKITSSSGCELFKRRSEPVSDSSQPLDENVVLSENPIPASSFDDRLVVGASPFSKLNPPLKLHLRNKNLVHEKLQHSKEAWVLEQEAAHKIQNSWKAHVNKKVYRATLKRYSDAANLIQSAWKGYVVRRYIKEAYASLNTSDKTNDDDDFEEVDLSQLEFDEDSYDQQWAFKTNILRGSITPRSPSRPLSVRSSSKNHRTLSSPNLQVQRSRNTSPEEVFNSQSMWQKIASLNKPPLPPITPTESATGDYKFNMSCVHSDPNSMLDSHRSKHSRKEEMLTNEWGLQNSSTTELMLKRARRMKGRRKKETTAQEKLLRFKELHQQVTQQPLMTQQKPSQPRNKMEYFKAREMEFEQRDKKPSEDDERRRQYTYEWLHTSASSTPSKNDSAKSSGHRPSPRSTIRHRHSSGSERAGFLPDITQHRVVPGSAQHNNDMEILSLSSYNSNNSKSKYLLRDIAKRHAGHL